MDVSRQETRTGVERGPKARTRRLMLAAATRLMQAGAIPSVSDVAEAADVSRATAYRYFPTQAVLVHAVVDEALGPILDWKSTSTEARDRTHSLLSESIPRIEAFEATFRAALKHALDQSAARNSGAEATELQFTRGHRIGLLEEALAPLSGKMPPLALDRLTKALSLLFGIEALIVLKDIWGVDGEEARDVIVWAADMLMEAVQTRNS